MVNIGKRIEKFMIERGLNARQLSKLCDVSPEWIYKVINGDHKNVGVEKLESIAHALGVEVVDLLYSNFGKVLHKEGERFDRAVEKEVASRIKEQAPAYRLDKEALDIVESMDHMTPSQRKLLVKMAKEFAGNSGEEHETHESRVKTQKKIS